MGGVGDREPPGSLPTSIPAFGKQNLTPPKITERRAGIIGQPVRIEHSSSKRSHFSARHARKIKTANHPTGSGSEQPVEAPHLERVV